MLAIDTTYEAECNSVATSMLKELVHSSEMCPGRVLDLGAGKTCRNSVWLPPGFTPTVVDKDPQSIATAAAHGIAYIDSDFTECDLPDTDHAIAVYSMRFNPQDVIAKMVRDMVTSIRRGRVTSRLSEHATRYLLLQDFTMHTPNQDGIPGTWYDPEMVAATCAQADCHILDIVVETVPTIYLDGNQNRIPTERSTIVAQVCLDD